MRVAIDAAVMHTAALEIHALVTGTNQLLIASPTARFIPAFNS